MHDSEEPSKEAEQMDDFQLELEPLKPTAKRTERRRVRQQLHELTKPTK